MYEALPSFLGQHHHLIGEVVGFLAGAAVLYSGWPPLREQLYNPKAGTSAERKSHLFLATGNGLLIISSAFTGALVVCGLAAINTLIRFEIWRRMNAKVQKHSKL